MHAAADCHRQPGATIINRISVNAAAPGPIGRPLIPATTGSTCMTGAIAPVTAGKPIP